MSLLFKLVLSRRYCRRVATLSDYRFDCQFCCQMPFPLLPLCTWAWDQPWPGLTKFKLISVLLDSMQRKSAVLPG